MSYRAPKLIQNSLGLLQRGKAIDDFNAGLDKEFDELTKIQVENAKAVAKQQEAFKKRRFKDINKFNKKLTKSGLLEEGENSSTAEVLKQIKKEYYACAGKMTDECSENMEFWRQIPNQIAQGLGASEALTGQYRGIMENAEGEANSLDVDNTDPTLNRFGQEFVENDGRNVQCGYDSKTRQIYWEIADINYSAEDLEKLEKDDPEKYKHIMDDADAGADILSDDVTEPGGYKREGVRIYNNALVKTQTDKNNKIPFFPTHGDSKPVIDVIHNGSDDVDGLSVGLDKDKEILVIKGKEGEEDVEFKGQAEINKQLRKRLAAYDFSGTLDSPISKTLYSRSLKKNLEKLDKLKGKDVNNLTSTEKRLLKTWYGNNWEKNFQGEFEEGDEKDMMAVYEKDGTAGFGPWIGSDPKLAETNPTANFQRGVVSNGLIMDYEKEYLYEEEEAEVINDQDAAEVDTEVDTEVNTEVDTEVDTASDEVGVNIETKPGTESISGTNIPKEQIDIEDKNITTGFATQSGGMNSYADDKITVFDNTNVDNLSGSPDEVPGLNFMIGIENTVGCMSGGKPVPCGGYGANEEEIKKTITRINKENLGKGTYKDNKGRIKKALNNSKMWGDDWDKLPEEFKTSILQYNFNSAWDPRVVTMIANGDIDIADRGSYHRDADKLQKKWDEVKGKIDYSKLDNKKLRNEMTDVYKHTYGDEETWKYNTLKEPTKPVGPASSEVKNKYKKDKAQYDKYAAKANPIIKELNILAEKIVAAKNDIEEKKKLQEQYRKYAKDNNFNFKDGTFLPDNYPSYEARMNLVNKRYKV